MKASTKREERAAEQIARMDAFADSVHNMCKGITGNLDVKQNMNIASAILDRAAELLFNDTKGGKP